MKTAVVVPSNRPERVAEFCHAWGYQFDREDVRLIVCEDNAERTAKLPDWVEHYCWADIDAQMGETGACIPRRSGGVRSFGFWLAGKDPSIDMVVSLDDDCRPLEDDFLGWHWRMLNQPRALRWYSTMPIPTRGYPYGVRAPSKGHPYWDRDGSVLPMVNHGLWSGVPDVDAYHQLRDPNIRLSVTDKRSELVPPGQYFTMCIMNVAFRREAAPYMYMPPLPEGMKRWDDIWCGLIIKRIADVHGWAITSGWPAVQHERASDPLNNLKQEMLGYGINERLWQVLDGVRDGCEPMLTYRFIGRAMEQAFPELAPTVRAMEQWAGLWEREGDTTMSDYFCSRCHHALSYDPERKCYCPHCEKEEIAEPTQQLFATCRPHAGYKRSAHPQLLDDYHCPGCGGWFPKAVAQSMTTTLSPIRVAP